ncbi:transketolase C-terminal domain-containing protein [Actinosynnema sp. NPDC020468]|uniref:alpha-ketoacid dehydrogenase subunit beta n=1 Tax=Actinosynnema sp. NPDC020468 TaxID=3154488 RepID=UPI0033D821E6
MTGVLTRTERVAENLNSALHGLLEADPSAYVLGEDLADPYGGAFKVTRGLSTRFPDRVLSTPLSESGIVGVAGGLALAGDTAVVEIMFSDFVALAFDQILNFATKSVSMYGTRVPMRLVVRCPTGGGRSYGPTHSQSLQKHFVGIAHLSLFETSPFRDNAEVLAEALATGEPSVLFEDKVLYAQRMFRDGVVDDVLRYDVLPDGTARVFVDDPDEYDCVLVAPGGVAARALAAARSLLMEDEITCLVLVPSRLYPFTAPVPRARFVCVVEEGTAGGTWGAEVAHRLHATMWGSLAAPVRLVHSAAAIVPTAPHLERRVLVQAADVQRAVKELVTGA